MPEAIPVEKEIKLYAKDPTQVIAAIRRLKPLALEFYQPYLTVKGGQTVTVREVPAEADRPAQMFLDLKFAEGPVFELPVPEKDHERIRKLANGHGVIPLKQGWEARGRRIKNHLRRYFLTRPQSKAKRLRTGMCRDVRR